MKAPFILQFLLLVGLCLWNLTATCLSQPNMAFSSPTDLESQVQLAIDTSELTTLYGLLDNKSAKVQQTVLTRLGKMKEPQAAPRILDFLAVINVTVEGSEVASVNLNLKRLAIAAFESNTGLQFGAVELHNLSDIENHIKRARKSFGVSSPTNTIKTEPDKTGSAPPARSVTQKPTPSLPVQPTPPPSKFDTNATPTPNEYLASSTQWSIIVILIMAAIVLLWLLIKRRS